MILLKNRLINSSLITIISLFFSFLFMFFSGQEEFLSILPEYPASTEFWENWRQFLLSGNIKYIGIITIAASLIILARTVYITLRYKQPEFDEYEISVLQKGLSISGMASILLIPILMALTISQPTFAVPYMLLFVTLIWSSFVLASLVFAFR